MSDVDGPVGDEEEFIADDLPPTPFSFKLVVVLGGAYLLYRAVQLDFIGRRTDRNRGQRGDASDEYATQTVHKTPPLL